MNDDLISLEHRLDLISRLSKYRIEFGIFAEDISKKVSVDILNADDSITKIDMEIGDIMYFTEHGTMTIPARPILETSLYYIETNLNKTLDTITDGILNFYWSEDEVLKHLEEFATSMQIYLRAKVHEMVNNNATLANILDQKDENKYIYDLKQLKNYIKCKIIY